MPLRTATATGTIINDGNIAADFRVNLWVQLLDSEGNVVFGYPMSTDEELASLGQGMESDLLTLTGTVWLGAGYTLMAWVTLDRISPEALDGIASTPTTSFTEAVVVGGSLVGFTPTIEALVEDLLREIPGLDGFPAVARVT